MALVVLALAYLAYELAPRILGSRSASTSDSGTDAGAEDSSDDAGGDSEDAGPTKAEPVEAEAIIGAVTPLGFQCSVALEEPLPITTCYRTERDGALSSVQIQAEPSGDVGHVTAVSETDYFMQGAERGEPTEAFAEIFPVVGDVLLGPEAADMPSLELEQDERLLEWGTVTAYVSPPRSMGTFNRDGFSRTSEAPFPVDVDTTQQEVPALGYECEDASWCSKGPATGALYRSVRINTYGGLGASLEARDGFKVTDAVVREDFGALLGIYFTGPELDVATKWLEESLDPAAGVARADFGGVHVRFDRKDTSVATLDVGELDLS